MRKMLFVCVALALLSGCGDDKAPKTGPGGGNGSSLGEGGGRGLGLSDVDATEAGSQLISQWNRSGCRWCRCLISGATTKPCSAASRRCDAPPHRHRSPIIVVGDIQRWRCSTDWSDPVPPTSGSGISRTAARGNCGSDRPTPRD